MMLKLIIRVTVLTFGVCLATLPTPQATSQALTNLNEKVTEMINALHAASPLTKLKSAAETLPTSSSSGSTALTYPYYQIPSMPLPQMVYMPLPSSAASAPTTGLPSSSILASTTTGLALPSSAILAPTSSTTPGLASGIQPIDYVNPVISNPVPRSIMPSISYPCPSFYPLPFCEVPQPSYAQGYMPPLAMPIPGYSFAGHPYSSYPTKQTYSPSSYPLVPLTEFSSKSI